MRRIQVNESRTSLLKVTFRVFTSNGTAPDTGLSNDSLRISFNGASEVTATNLISATSAGAGMYAYTLATPSEVSQLGHLTLSYEQGDFPQHVATIEIVTEDPFGTMTVPVTGALQAGSTTEIRLPSTATTTDDWYRGAAVFLQYPSGEVIGNIISDYTGSNKSAALKNTLPITASSAVTCLVIAGTPETDLSSQTVLGVSRLDSSVTLRSVVHSGATIDGSLFLGTAGERSIASSILSTNMGNNRIVQEALFALRNRVDASSSVMTIYKTDDSTSAWTATIGTGSNPINSIDPL